MPTLCWHAATTGCSRHSPTRAVDVGLHRSLAVHDRPRDIGRHAAGMSWSKIRQTGTAGSCASHVMWSMPALGPAVPCLRFNVVLSQHVQLTRYLEQRLEALAQGQGTLERLARS